MSNETGLPLVSVAMPIYNEGKYIEETLESVLKQDYANLEILLFDNASTDKTSEICEAFSANDPRIKYYRHKSNIGAAENFDFSFKASKGKYFMWAAGHDKWSANLITKSVKLLESKPGTIIAFGTPVWIDENGQSLNKMSGWCSTHGQSTTARFFMVLWGSMNPILGLIKRDQVDHNFDKYNYAGSDMVFLEELALRGSFIHITNATFYRRQNRPKEDHQKRMKRYNSDDIKLSSSFFSRFFPLARLPIELVKAVIRSPIGLLEKILIIALLIPSLPIRYIAGRKDSAIKN